MFQKMNFKVALNKLSTWNSADKLDETRRKWIYELNLEINQFLESSQGSFTLIIETNPELGQLMAVLSQDELVITTPELFQLFVDNLLWFYRPTSIISLEMKASEWARKLLRNMIAFPKTKVQEISPNINLRSGQLSTEKLLQKLHRILRNHLRGKTCTNIESFDLLARDASVLLRNKHFLDFESIQIIINALPSVYCKSCTAEVRSFYRNLDQVLITGSINFPEILHEKLGEKYPTHVENEIINLVWQWVNKGENSNMDTSSSWLINATSHNKHLFRTSLSILNAIFIKSDTDVKLAEFIHRFLRDVRSAMTTDVNSNAVSSLAQLYPEHLSHLVYLLDVDSADLDERLEEQHSLFLVQMLTKVIADRSVDQAEAVVLLVQFQGWWNSIQRLSKHPDPMVFMHRFAHNMLFSGTLSRELATFIRDDKICRMTILYK